MPNDKCDENNFPLTDIFFGGRYHPLEVLRVSVRLEWRRVAKQTVTVLESVYYLSRSIRLWPLSESRAKLLSFHSQRWKSALSRNGVIELICGDEVSCGVFFHRLSDPPSQPGNGCQIFGLKRGRTARCNYAVPEHISPSYCKAEQLLMNS